MILRDSLIINGSLSVLGVSNAVSSNLTALFYNNTNGNVEKRTIGDIINYNASNFLSGFNISVPSIFTTNVSSITPQNNQLTLLLASQSAGTVFAAHPSFNGQPSFMKLTASHLSDAEVMFTNHPANIITSGNINTWNNLANSIGDYLPKSYNSTSAIAVSKLIGGTNTTSRIKIRLPYKTNATKMLAFTIRMYGSYRHTDIACSGYLYSTPNQWYTPSAKIIVDHGSSSGSNIDVIFGRDDDGIAYVSIPSRQYYGVAVIDVVGGYANTAYGSGWEILDNDTTPNIGSTITANGNYALISDIKTYTAGNGLTLSGTAFSLPVTVSGSGTFVQSVTQTTNGITVTLGTPPNTTYTAGNGLTLSGTQFSLPVSVSGTGNVVSDVVTSTNGITVSKNITALTVETDPIYTASLPNQMMFKSTIPANANLDNYTETGVYGTPADSIAVTITNSPSVNAFTLEVIRVGSGMIFQRVTQHSTRRVYVRNFNNTWFTWSTVASLTDIKTYTAGNGLTLSGTQFSLPVTTTGSGNVVDTVVSSTNGVTVTKNLNAMLTSHPANTITSGDISFWNTLSGLSNTLLNYLPLSGGSMTGKLFVSESLSSGAGLNIPHGVTPTTATLENGDVWTTTSAIFVRLNGTTRQIAHTSSWSEISEAEISAGTASSARFISSRRLQYAFNNIVAARASKLESGATINGVLFDGTQPITISAEPLAHTHNISEVIGLQSALDNKQPLNSNLTSISTLTSGTGLLKRNANNTWVIDTTSYLSSESDPFGVSTLTVSGTTNKVISVKLRNNNIVSATIDAVTEAELNGTTSDNAKLISSLVLKNYIDNRLSTTMNYKGQVTNYSNLPTTGNNIGDVYNVVNANTSPALKAGDNVAWNGTSWDVLAGFVDISNLITNTQNVRLIGDITASGALTSNITTTIADGAVTSGKLANIGTAGTYNNVSVNAKGQVTGGSNIAYSLTSHTHNNLVATNTAGALDINAIVKPSRQFVIYNNIGSASTNMFPMSNNANAVLHIGTHNSDYWHQLGFSSNNKLYHRSQNNTWNEIAYANSLNGYLPLSGGNMTGNITLISTWNQPSLIKDITVTVNPTYGFSLLRGKNSNADKGLGISNQGDLVYGDWANVTNLSSQWDKIYHSGNLTNLSQLTNDVGYVTTDTTYSAGNGLTLSGTQFSMPVTVSGSGTFVSSVTQTANGITVTLGTPPNTTYSAGNGLTLSGTQFSLPVTTTGSGNVVDSVVTSSNGITVTKNSNAMLTSHPANTITSAMIANYNTSFGWGNHAGLYPSRAVLGNTINSIRVSDTRSTDPLPTTAYKSGAWFDFKQTASIGLTGLGQSTYAATMTIVPYSDDSGNQSTAFVLAQSSNNLYFKQYSSANQWGTWNRLVTHNNISSYLPETTRFRSNSNAYLSGDITLTAGSNVTLTQSGNVITVSSTNTNTTYSAGNGLTLSGTAFSLPVTVSGSGTYVQSVVQTTNGITVTLGTPPNTTYSAGTLALLTAGTDTSNRVWSANILSDFLVAQVQANDTLEYNQATGGIQTRDWTSEAFSQYSMALGNYTTVQGIGAISLGYGVATYGMYSQNVGAYSNVNAPYSVNLGTYNAVNVPKSGTFGLGLLSDQEGLYAVGRYNTIETQIFPYFTERTSLQKVFVVGTGLDDNSRKNAIEVYQDNSTQFLGVPKYSDSLTLSTISGYLNYDPRALVNKKYLEEYVTANASTAIDIGTVAHITGANTTTRIWSGSIIKSWADSRLLHLSGGTISGLFTVNGTFTAKGSANHIMSDSQPSTIPALGTNTHALKVGNSSTNYGTLFGSLSNGQGYIQQGRTDGTATPYQLNLNPNGGNVAIGNLSGTGNRMVITNASGVLSSQALPINTTYTAGNGLTLSGTAFSLPVTVSGTGTYVQSVTQTASGLTVTLGTPPNTNTTYAAGSYALLTAGTDTTYRVWTAESISAWINSKGYSTITTMLRAENSGSWMSGGLTLLGGNNVTITPSNNAFTISSVNTTYSAGNGLTLSGTQFSLPVTVSGSGSYVQSVAQTASGLTVTLGTPPNSTYSAGTLALLTAGTDSSNRVWAANVLDSWLSGKGYLTNSDISSLTSTKLRANTNSLISGDITLSAGTNTSLTQSGNVITINSTDTNTTYSAGNGLTLSGTAFSLPVTVTGTGTYVQSVVQTANGITVTLGTPPDNNTTYAAGDLTALNSGTDTTNRVWGASVLSNWLNNLFNFTSSVGYNTTSKYLGRSIVNIPNGVGSGVGEINLWQSLISSGSPLYDDPEFISGLNGITHYNNSGNIERIVDDQKSNNKSGYILKITNNSAGAVGIYHNINAMANRQSVQLIRAKIPVGYRLQQYNNSLGNTSSFQWLSSTHGTGKWEWYILLASCGDSGTYSNYGHLGISVTTGTALSSANPLVWYISYANAYDITKGIGTSLFARKLETPRTINGVLFDGSTNITVADSTKLPLTGGSITGSLGISTLAGTGNRMVITNASGVLSTQAIPTDTTYSAGNGLTLSGTQFSLPVTVSGSGSYVQSVSQTASGLTVTLGTPPNTDTTYSAGTLALLTAGTDTANRIWSAKILTDFTDGRYFKTQVGVPTDLKLEYRNGTGQWLNTTLNTPIANGYGTWMNIVSTGGDHNNTSNWINQLMFPASNESRIFYRSKINAGEWGNTYELHTTRSISTSSINSWNNAVSAISSLTNTKIRSNANSLLTGDVTLTGGSNVTLSQSGNTITINATDTNTTYSAGNGLTLSGTQFSLPVTASGTGNTLTGLTQATNGLTASYADRMPLFTNRPTQDLNILRTSGIYGGGSGSNETTNYPSEGYSYSPYMVLQSSVDRFAQIWVDSWSGNNNNDTIHYRSGSNTQWGAWRKMWHSGNLTKLSQLTNDVGFITSNTTYSAGNGLTLSGTQFSLPVTVSGSGTFVQSVTQTTNGITVTLGTPTVTSAGQLTTARTIGIGTAVSGTATSFNGTQNITIPVTNVKEAYLTFGGKSISGGFSALDAALVPELGANRLAFMPPEGITTEYSRDNGVTWVNFGSDANKINLFNGNGSNHQVGGGGYAVGTNYTNYKLRIRIDTSLARVYTTLNKFIIYVSTNGSTGTYCSIKAKTNTNFLNNVDTWLTLANNEPINGWSGYNTINVPAFTTFGNSASQYRIIEFEFGQTGYSTTYTGLQVSKIFGFGGMGWTTPSTLAKNGQLYTYDYLKNVAFEGTVRSNGFIKSGSTDSYLLLGGGGHKLITDFALSTHTHTFASLTSKPTTLSGYGITDAGISGAVSNTATGTTDVASTTNGNTYINRMQGGVIKESVRLVGAGSTSITHATGGVITITSTDTNTTYSAGNGLTLSGTQFSVPVTVSGTGTYVQSVAQTASGLTVTLGTPPNNNTDTVTRLRSNANALISGDITLTAGSNVTLAQSGNVITINATNTNTDTVTRLRSNANALISGDITLTAGSNVTLSQSGNVITINATNTNTTYSAGNGLTLSGTAFSLPVTTSGSGTFVQSVTQTTNGITVTMGTPPSGGASSTTTYMRSVETIVTQTNLVNSVFRVTLPSAIHSSSVMVFLNGVKIPRSKITISGTTINITNSGLLTPIILGDFVEIEYLTN